MLSIVTHHLTPLGLERFPDWFARMRALLAEQPGFVSVRLMCEAGDPATRVVLLDMRSEADVERWISSDGKRQLLLELPELSSRPFEALRLLPIATGADAR